MQKPKTQVKHDNLVAQISVLKGELNTVNKELTNKIKERNSLKNELISGRKELDKIKGECHKIDKQSKVRAEELDNKELLLESRDKKIIKTELAFIKKMKVDKKSFDDKISLYSNTVLDLQGKIQLRKQDLEIEIDNVKHYTDLSKELKKEVNVLSQERNILENDIQKLNKQTIEELSDFDAQLERRENKLKEIEENILIEQEKIKLPEKSIREKEKELQRKKKNLDIIIRRFNKKFKEKFPLQDLKL